jgi:hypothetical protein
MLPGRIFFIRGGVKMKNFAQGGAIKGDMRRFGRMSPYSDSGFTGNCVERALADALAAQPIIFDEADDRTLTGDGGRLSLRQRF